MAVNLTGATPDSAADQKLAALAAAQTVSTKNSGEDDAMGEVGGAEALLYLRVSTKRQAQSGGQAEGFSLPAQREAATRKAETIGATVAGEYVDRGESARSANRPQLQQMLGDIKAGLYPSVRYLIVHKIDRLARNRADDIAINAELDKAGIELISCSEFFDNSPGGLLQYGIQAEMAQYYSRNLAQEVLKGSTQKAKTGGTPYRAPLGYLNERSYEDGRERRFIAIDSERAPLIQWCFEQYATDEWTSTNLLAEVTKKGLRSRPTAKRPAKPISITGFLHLLKNPYYMGLVRYRGALYPGDHEALVNPELWLRVQDVLAGHYQAGEKTRTHPHYLKGTVYCASCESRLVFTRAKGNGGSYDYFFCLGRQQHLSGRLKAFDGQHQSSAAHCTQPHLRVELIEIAVEEYYRSTVQLSEQRAAAIRQAVTDELEHQTTGANLECQRQETNLARLDDERGKLLAAHYAEAIPLDLMKSEMERLTRETANAKAQLKAAGTKWVEASEVLDQALKLASSCHQHYSQAPGSIRRQLNQGLFEKIYVGKDGDVERVELTDAFSLLLADDLLQQIEAETGGEGKKASEQATHGETPRTPLQNEEEPDPFGSGSGHASFSAVHGLNIGCVVGPRGLEPLTSAV